MFIELTLAKSNEKFIINVARLIYVSATKTGCCLRSIDGDCFYVKETYEFIAEQLALLSCEAVK